MSTTVIEHADGLPQPQRSWAILTIAILSVNGALVRYTYPRAQLGRGIGVNALVVAVSAAVGLP